jgi:hypothetical protein
MNLRIFALSLWTAVLLVWSSSLLAQENAQDLDRALRRAQYLLMGTIPTDQDFQTWAVNEGAYRSGVRTFIEHPNFYDVVLRYHERILGVGLPQDYLDELMRDEIDNRTNKFARISCNHTTGTESRYRCMWSSSDSRSQTASCPASWEQAVSVFWYPGVIAWVCPSVAQACGSDLSRCFIEYEDQGAARNSELGATEIFDSTAAVVKSLSRQPAGLATAVVVNNYPYSKILEPGLFAVDGAIAHLYRQVHHFDLAKLNLPSQLLNIVDTISLTDTRYRLVNLGHSYEQAGILSTFGWLRRYEKNRTRANQLYERLLCRRFTAELPRVFPQDPGNLRTTPGCEGCHATLDPLADFFAAWGEGGDLYLGALPQVTTSFAGQTGSTLADLANIIRNDNAFGTCTVENVWEWLMGRKFYHAEAELRAALTQYFVTTGYSFKELVYAVATHPAFTVGTRSDASVGDPLEQPPLGEPPGGASDRPCPDTVDFTADIQPKLSLCTACHSASSTTRQALTTEDQWRQWGRQSVNMMASGNMPPGQAGPPQIGAVWELKEAVRCWMEQNQ